MIIDFEEQKKKLADICSKKESPLKEWPPSNEYEQWPLTKKYEWLNRARRLF